MKKITLVFSMLTGVMYATDLQERLKNLQVKAETFGQNSSQTKELSYADYSFSKPIEKNLNDACNPPLTSSFDWQGRYQEDISQYRQLIQDQEQKISHLQSAIYSHKTLTLRALENVLSAQEFSIKTFYPSVQRASNILLLVPLLSEEHYKKLHHTILGTLVEEHMFLSHYLATESPFFSSLCEVIPWGIPLMLGYIWNRDTHYVIACTAINSLFFACTYLKKHLSLRKKQEEFNKIEWPDAVLKMPDHTKKLYSNPIWRNQFCAYLEMKEGMKKTLQLFAPNEAMEFSKELKDLQEESKMIDAAITTINGAPNT